MKKKVISVLLSILMLQSICNFAFISVSATATALKIGDYVQMGQYQGSPILWRVVDIDATNGPLMLSDKVLTYKMFDAAGSVTTNNSSHGRDTNSDTPSSTNKTRKGYGSNFWADSNMRSWLNSEANTGSIQWLCGNPPALNSSQTYQNENGFLTNFTSSERNVIKSVSQKTHVSNLDVGLVADSRLGTTAVTGTTDIVSNVSFGAYPGGITANYDSTYGQYVTDKVFLLDLKQLTSIYYKSNTASSVLGLGYHSAKINSTDTTAVFSSLRAPSGTGTAHNRGSNVRLTSSTNNDTKIASADSNNNGTLCAVRPAFYLNESIVAYASGNGAVGTPYLVGDNTSSIVSVIKSQNNVNVSIIKASSESRAKLLLGVYGENKKLINLLSTDVTSATSYNFDLSGITANIISVKAFLVEGLDTMRPLAKSKEIPVAQIVVDKNFYPDWTRKAVTFSFDDGTTSDERLIGIMNSAGLKGTFNFFQNNYTYFTLPLTTSGAKDYTALMNIYQGHEIANHSKSHIRMYLDGLPADYTPKTVSECIADIEGGKAWLESIPQIGGGNVKGFAWPYKDPLRPELTAYLATPASGISYARPVTTTLTTSRKYDIPTNFLNWEFTTHHKFLATVGPEFINLADDGNLKLLSVWGHAYEFADAVTAGNTALDWSLMENFAALVNQRTDVKLWKATNIQICEYANALNNLKVYDSYVKNDSNIDLYIKVNNKNVIVKANSEYLPEYTAPTIYIASDSTAADWSNPDSISFLVAGVTNYYPETGWGQMLGNYFKANAVKVDNRAIPGYTAGSFIANKLTAMASAILPGDYVLIQFGHNDQKTFSLNDYKANLTTIINTVAAKGAIPVLITSPVRGTFSGGVLVDSANTTTGNTLKNYADTTIALANNLNIGVIDLNSQSRTIVSNLGDPAFKDLYLYLVKDDTRFVSDSRFATSYNNKDLNDPTHLLPYGADTFAGIIATDLKNFMNPALFK